MIRKLIFISHFLIIVSVCSVNAGTISPQLQSLITNKQQSAKVDVIIEFNKNISLQPNNFKAKKNIRQEIINSLKNNQFLSKFLVKSILKNNRIEIKDLWINNSLAATVPVKLISKIASQDSVLSVRLDRKIVLDSSGSSGPPAQIDWNISIIGADKVWNQGILGNGVTIGSMDSGVDINHPDLLSSWRGGSNSWFDPYGVYTFPHDSNGHGTQTTSLIVGGDLSGFSIGVAPSAQWIAAKIFDDSNTATISAIHLAFQWMLDPDNDSNTNDSADIVNNSWNFGNSTGQCDYEFQNDISILRAADVAVVFSAGNSGPNPDTSLSPANNKDTIPIGAIDESLNISFSSSRGPSACDINDIYPQLSAPGINVYTADLTFGGAIPNSYTYSSGTSYAAPHVAGSLALLQSIYPDSSLTDRESALKNSALSMGPLNNYGAGIIDVDAALQYMFNVQDQNSNLLVNLSNPIGKIGANSTPTFTWTSLSTATNYKLWIKDSSGNVDQIWYTPTEVNCSNGEALCSINSVLLFEDGSYSWKVRTRNTLGLGPWTTKQNFIIGELPAAVLLVSPLGSVGVNTTPNFVWNSISGTTNYKFWVKEVSSGVVNQVWHTPSEVNCANGESTCSLTLTTPFADGIHTWKVRARNLVGLGPWATQQSIIIGDVPKVVDLISPSDTIEISSTPTFMWHAILGATYYKFWVKEVTSGVVNQVWFTPSEVNCANGESTCSLTLTTPFADGIHTWKVRARNLVGLGSWATQQSFIISEVLATVDVISPSDLIETSSTQTLIWYAILRVTD